MNQTTPTHDVRTGPGEDLDRLLSEFFQSQLRHPWPPAPAVRPSEPSTLAARSTPGVARDSGGRARYTLAASVALLLGACWVLSNGFQPGDPSGGSATRPGPGIDLNKGTAADPPALKELRNDKAKNGPGGVFVPPPVKFMP